MQVAVLPLLLVTVMVAVPTPTAVTLPNLFTVATLSSLLVQVYVSTRLTGLIVAKCPRGLLL